MPLLKSGRSILKLNNEVMVIIFSRLYRRVAGVVSFDRSTYIRNVIIDTLREHATSQARKFKVASRKRKQSLSLFGIR